MKPDLSYADFEKIEERFWIKVSRGDLNDCWGWNGSSSARDGRGRCWVKDRMLGAPRVAWILTNKSVPSSSLFACHTCDNPNCVNPTHIWFGTNQENIQDASKKRRLPGQQVTHCPRGHEYDEENTLLIDGHRGCKACKKFYNQKYYDSTPGARELKQARNLRCKLKQLEARSSRLIAQIAQLERAALATTQEGKSHDHP